MTTHKTGRLLHHDPLSRGFEHSQRLIQPRTVIHRLDAPALDQGNLSACTGFAAAQWLNCRASARARKRYNKFRPASTSAYVTNYDGRALYSEATALDDFDWVWPTVDNGSSGLGVAKALKFFGAIDRYEHTFSFDGFIAALQTQPVLIGTVWPDSMFDPDRNGIIRAVGSLDINTGHEYLGAGFNWPRKLIRIRNSWSPNWGINGDAYIPIDDMQRLLAAQGDCTVPIVL